MFWRAVVGYLPVQIVQALVSLGSIVVFTRLLTPHEYGQYALAFTVAALVQTLSTSWTEAAMERFHQAELEHGDPPSHLVTLYRAHASIAAVTVLAGALLVPLLPLELHLKLAVAASIAAAMLRSGFVLVQHRRRGSGQVGPYAANDIVFTLGGFALGAWLASRGWGATAPFVGIAIAAAACLVVGARGEARRAQGGGFEKPRLRRYAGYGLPVSMSLLLAVVISGTDRILLAAFLDEATAGAYHAGYNLANRTLDILFVWLGLAGGPAMIDAFEREGPDGLHKTARVQGDLMILIGLPAAVGLALVARPLAELLVGEALREDAARAVPWIAAAGFFGGVTGAYLDNSFTLARRPGLLLASMVVPAVANVALCLALIPPFGLQGALAATSLSLLIGAAASYVLGRRALSLPIPLTTLFRCGLACGVMAAMLRIVPPMPALPELLLKASLGAAVYAGVVLLLDAGAVRSGGLARVLLKRSLARSGRRGPVT